MDASFSKQLAENYDNHPAFDLGCSPLHCPTEWVEVFEKNYNAIYFFQDRLSPSEFKKCKSDTTHALEKIFQDLSRQTQDPYELRFFSELLNECQAMLLWEMNFYQKSRKNGGIHFPGSAQRYDAVGLFSDAHFFGRLRSAAVQEILEAGKEPLVRFRQNAAAGKLTRDDLSANQGPAVRQITRILNREYKDLGVLDSLSAFMGRRTYVTGLAFELSVSNANWWRHFYSQVQTPPKTVYAHLDQGIWAPKSIVYLTDVTEANGPTSCYPHVYNELGLNRVQELIGRNMAAVGSNANSPLKSYYQAQYHQPFSSEKFRRHFLRIPPELRFNSHFGWDIMPGSPAEATLLKKEKVMVGPAGTFIVFDGGRLLHRGGQVKSGDRIALQVIFDDAKSIPQKAWGRLQRLVRAGA